MFWTQRNLPIGERRVIKKFKVSEAGGKYRPIGHDYKGVMRRAEEERARSMSSITGKPLQFVNPVNYSLVKTIGLNKERSQVLRSCSWIQNKERSRQGAVLDDHHGHACFHSHPEKELESQPCLADECRSAFGEKCRSMSVGRRLLASVTRRTEVVVDRCGAFLFAY
ncbi:Uncharacterized protein Rs2_04794 [Raphanus sativus]|nr:Uncharacterized protein Rs2_04794 [Raphanus sativus]